MAHWLPLVNDQRLHPFLWNTYRMNSPVSRWNPWDVVIGTITVVSSTTPLYFFIPTRPTMTGLDFVLQLCVEDDERAGTVLAVSNK